LPDSRQIGARIEELYGLTLSELHAHARCGPPGMLAALLDAHHRLVLAEQSITVHSRRLQQLAQREQALTAPETSHLFDCARRLAEAVAVRDTHTATTQAVLQSLCRAPVPEPAAEPEPAPETITDPVPDPPAAAVADRAPIPSVPAAHSAMSR
jgi:hypothetical protein